MVCVLGIIIISIYSICYWSLYGVFLFCFYSIGSIPDILQLLGLEHGKAQKHLTGIKGLSLLLSVSFQQALGYLIYALICETSTFHRFVYYTDEEYEMFDFKLYPGIEGFYYISEGFAVISIITAMPFIVLFIMRTIRYLFFTIAVR